MDLTRREFLAGLCTLSTPRLVWVGGKRRWSPTLRRPRPGDLVRFAGDVQARVVLAYGWHAAAKRCMFIQKDWAAWCLDTFSGDGYVLPSASGRGVIDVVGYVHGLKSWPGRVRRIDGRADSSWSCVPYAVRIAQRP